MYSKNFMRKGNDMTAFTNERYFYQKFDELIRELKRLNKNFEKLVEIVVKQDE